MGVKDGQKKHKGNLEVNERKRGILGNVLIVFICDESICFIHNIVLEADKEAGSMDGKEICKGQFKIQQAVN